MMPGPRLSSQAASARGRAPMEINRTKGLREPWSGGGCLHLAINTPNASRTTCPTCRVPGGREVGCEMTAIFCPRLRIPRGLCRTVAVATRSPSMCNDPAAPGARATLSLAGATVSKLCETMRRHAGGWCAASEPISGDNLNVGRSPFSVTYTSGFAVSDPR